MKRGLVIVLLLLSSTLGCDPLQGLTGHEALRIREKASRAVVCIASSSKALSDSVKRLIVSARRAGFASIQLAQSVEEALENVLALSGPTQVVVAVKQPHVVFDETSLVPCSDQWLAVGPVQQLLHHQAPRRACALARTFNGSGTEYCKAYQQALSRARDRPSSNPVNSAIRGAVAGYLKYGSLQDEVRPLSLTPLNWLGGRITVFDSLSTVMMSGQHDLESELRTLVLKHGVPGVVNQFTKVFEYHIRVCGGLLGAYSLSGDPLYLSLAAQTADMFLVSFEQFVLPLRADVLAPPSSWLAEVIRRVRRWYLAGEASLLLNSLAGVGSYALEFEYLSRETGDARYRKAAAKIHRVLAQVAGSKHPSIIRYNGLNVEAPQRHGCASWGPFGSGSDSFYEYLRKTPLLLERSGAVLDPINRHRKRWDARVRRVEFPTLKGLPLETSPPDDETDERFTHLMCFLPGLLALNGTKADLRRAATLAEGILKWYRKLNFAPEHLNALDGRYRFQARARDPSYQLRPEFVESLAVLLAETGESRWAAAGREIFESIERFCKLDNGMYASLKTVYDCAAGGHLDEQPSFFIAETLKYLWLLHEDASETKRWFQAYVFTTEGHPLRASHPLCSMVGRVGSPCEDLLDGTGPGAHLPGWHGWIEVAPVIGFSLVLVYVSTKIFLRK